MKIIVACDSYKDTLSAFEVCENIEKGIKKINKEINVIKIPMADGGEGTANAIQNILGGETVEVLVNDPLFRKIRSSYVYIEKTKTAIIEMARASGLELLELSDRNPMNTTTYGTGELILDAINKGCNNLLIGIGGSATNDGGIGMAHALGVRFYDKSKNEISLTGKGLLDIKSIDINNLDSRIKDCNIKIMCDVDNVLHGQYGAAYVYAKQKGANESMIHALDDGLINYANVIKNSLNYDVSNIKGAGAAGGLGAGIIVFLNGTIQRGIDAVIDIVNLEEKIKDADLVITGEGRIDYQTKFGKVPYGVAQIAKKHNKPVIAICGSIGEKYEELYNCGIDAIFATTAIQTSIEEYKKTTPKQLEQMSEAIVRTFFKKSL